MGTAAVTTLGMRAGEMREIGAIVATVLQSTSPGTIASGPNQGKPSLVQFVLDYSAADAARSRVRDLLARHPLYPTVEL
jgi:glycine hydroxymethyltransferase